MAGKESFHADEANGYVVLILILSYFFADIGRLTAEFAGIYYLYCRSSLLCLSIQARWFHACTSHTASNSAQEEAFSQAGSSCPETRSVDPSRAGLLLS